MLDYETRKVVYAAVVSAAGLRIETEMIPSGVKSPGIAVRPVQCSRNKIIVQDADAEVDANVHGRRPWRTVGAAVTMKMYEIHGEGMAARPEHLQRAMKAMRLYPCGEVTAGSLKTSANNTRERLFWCGGHTRIA